MSPLPLAALGGSSRTDPIHYESEKLECKSVARIVHHGAEHYTPSNAKGDRR